ncbi:uncharacterized protein LOC110191231 [Drosophila serrata]|uniref:uncharacterized protein LOC110191231 n=1 Tax=Drosophila serrata TaxID=7274 RepID=UPI000A1D103E|nr:uncharacterized protein LOC110191231 [Drosophila serrata]
MHVYIDMSGIFLALLLFSLLCSAQNVTQSVDSQQGINVKILLQSSPSASLPESSVSTISTTTPKSEAKPTAKSSLQAHEIEEEDYNFHRDRLPALTEDEYSNLSEDANPLHFLKSSQSPNSEEKQTQSSQPEKSEQITTPSPAKPQPDPPKVAPPAAGSPIYITIPIYISTAGKQPLTLTIGDQELSLNKVRRPGGSGAMSRKNPSTKSPNSHFNRLLNKIESPKRRTTNRHRSQLKSYIYAMKERMDRKDARKI